MANLSNINNKFLVTTTGEVLIGQTANNGNRLQITGADGASYIYLKTDVATTGGRIGFNSDDLRVYNQQASGSLSLGTVGTEKMRITSGGDVYIGNSAITTANTAIFLQKSGLITNVLANSGGTTDLMQFYQQNSGGIGTISRNADGICMNGNGQTNQLVVADSGNVGIGGGAINSPASVGTFLNITGRNGVGAGTAGIVLKDYDNAAWDIWNSGGILNFRYNNGASGAGDGFSIGTTSNATFAGNVGIGVTADASVRTFIKGVDTGTNNYQILTRNSSDANILAVRNDGNVGIGTTPITSPNSADTSLSIFSGQDCSIILKDSVETWEIYQNDDLQFSFGTTPTTVMTMQRTTGNVGIGTTSLEGKLTIQYTSADPPTSGTTANSAIQILSNLSPPHQLNIGVVNAPSYGSYIQASDNNLAVNYSLLLQPNGGNVGIGTTSPNNKLEISDTGVGTGSTHLKISRGANATAVQRIAGIKMGNTASNDGSNWIIQADSSLGYFDSANLDFIHNAAGTANTKMRIESDGTIRAKTGSIVVDTAGQGIYLGGTAAANNLNYYASGTWTPTVTTSQLTSPTITSSSGRWQRVGKVVTASFEFTMSNPTVGAGSVIINNLPIAFADNQHVSGCGVIGDLGKTINVRYYTGNNQIAMNFYDGNYCGTAFRTVGTVTYWAAT